MVLVLLVLGVRGCLDARKVRSLKDYNRDASSIIAETQQTSDTFFSLLTDHSSLTDTEFTNEVKSARSAVDGYLTRIQNLSTPGDMNKAENGLELVYQLRASAMTVIADQLPTALGNAGAEKATKEITNQMQVLFSSDIVYSTVVKPEIERVLTDAGITDVAVPDSTFVPDGTKWLSESTVSSALGGTGASNTASTPGTHGTGLTGVAINGTDLSADAPTTVPASTSAEVVVSVTNQGANDESAITVSVTVDGGTAEEGTIDTLAAGETGTATISLASVPKGNATIDVSVAAVPGEQITENNKGSYDVTFQ